MCHLRILVPLLSVILAFFSPTTRCQPSLDDKAGIDFGNGGGDKPEFFTRYCENLDFSAFCIIDNHFKLLLINEYDEPDYNGTGKPYKFYPQFHGIAEKLFNEAPWREDEHDIGYLTPQEVIDMNQPTAALTTKSPLEKAKEIAEIRIPIVARASRTESLHTFHDMCDIQQILPDIVSGKPPDKFDQNDFQVDVTEIHVNGVRLHNHLHLKISSTSNKLIKYAFIVVNDQNGYAVGDFNTGVPCGYTQGDCNCGPKDTNCRQATVKDTIPCMYTSGTVVTHPGMIMFESATGVKEIHATWRFAQSTDPAIFTRELHFVTLLLEDETIRTVQRDCKLKYQFNNQEESKKCTGKLGSLCEYSKRNGRFGWNAKYKILHPTGRTTGAWDYFPKGFIKRKDVKCHVQLNKEYFLQEDFPTYGLTKDILSTKTCKIGQGEQWMFKVNQGPYLIAGALGSLYNALSWKTPAIVYFGVPSDTLAMIPSYLRPNPENTREPAFEIDRKGIATGLLKLKKKEDIAYDERCFCPRLGTAEPDVEKILPRKRQLEGRSDHAMQMAVAWIILVPLAIFVSRFYKETFSKVFFLQEYWWYTIHVLSLLLAFMFMLGGVYAIEIKREDPFNLDDPSQFMHAVIGGTSLLCFTCHVILGFFRVRKLNLRKVQIFLHWFFGVVESFLALAAMGTASLIIAGCMSCGSLISLGGYFGGQILFFGLMEIHMRKVDKQLKLKPKRSYLPPPVMRLFHTNAPGSKFRIWVLCAYAVFLCGCFGSMQYFNAITPYYGSCFDPNPDDTAERFRIREDQVHAEEQQQLPQDSSESK